LENGPCNCQHARRLVVALRREVIARRVQQQTGALGAAVLRGQLLIDPRGAGLIPGVFELLGTIDRWRQPRSLREARTTGKRRGEEYQKREPNELSKVHRLNSLSLAGRMPGGRDPYAA